MGVCSRCFPLPAAPYCRPSLQHNPRLRCATLHGIVCLLLPAQNDEAASPDQTLSTNICCGPAVRRKCNAVVQPGLPVLHLAGWCSICLPQTTDDPPTSAWRQAWLYRSCRGPRQQTRRRWCARLGAWLHSAGRGRERMGTETDWHRHRGEHLERTHTRLAPRSVQHTAHLMPSPPQRSRCCPPLRQRILLPQMPHRRLCSSHPVEEGRSEGQRGIHLLVRASLAGATLATLALALACFIRSMPCMAAAAAADARRSTVGPAISAHLERLACSRHSGGAGSHGVVAIASDWRQDGVGFRHLVLQRAGSRPWV